MAFFYPKIGNYEPTYISQLLEKSLSITLSLDYPYAGRLNKDDGNYVDCNDMGVELSHVHVHCPMSQIFRQPYTHAEHVVFPVDDQPYSHNEGKLATIQVTTNINQLYFVSSLLYKCARKVNNYSGLFKPSYLFQLANMRQRLNPPLSHGNILSGYFVEINNERDEIHHFIATGWGRPIRVSMGTGPFNNWFYLLDNQSGGGVEAIVMLDEQHLKEIQSYLSLLVQLQIFNYKLLDFCVDLFALCCLLYQGSHFSM
ncbi:hypothetical protein R3W88_028214 [Solanum pinnatisectum]|uniref:Uncharacterized protein n=1 Tax=Solanum pinnatisectum TaxID=50273 RepID=A0AAV9LLZ6_9SOLN|nr:hypothetical protein R3W88_028214 [Solanum pinnatisectum]